MGPGVRGGGTKPGVVWGLAAVAGTVVGDGQADHVVDAPPVSEGERRLGADVLEVGEREACVAREAQL